VTLDAALIEARDLVVAADYGQIYIYSPEAAREIDGDLRLWQGLQSI